MNRRRFLSALIASIVAPSIAGRPEASPIELGDHYLFQDAEGLIPVTKVGQQVRMIKSLVGGPPLIALDGRGPVLRRLSEGPLG
jgi:hypothetical protein